MSVPVGGTGGAGSTTGRLAREILLVPVRWSGLAAAVVFAVHGRWVDVAVAMLVALGQVLAWRFPVPVRWEVAISVTAVIAAVSSHLLLFERWAYWDLVVHFALTGMLAVLAHALLWPHHPGAARTVIAAAVLAVVWEVMEWLGYFWVTPEIYVTPWDTVTDILAGVLGAAVLVPLFLRDTLRDTADARRGSASSERC